MATASTSGTSHLGLTENQKRWLVAGIALNKILIPQIRPFVEQEVEKEYNILKTSHNVHVQSFPHHLCKWPATCKNLLKYENINGNDTLPKAKKHGKYFNYQVTSHVDFARLYVQNYMAHFTAFDDHCDASAVLTLLGGVPVFSAAVQTAAGDVRKSMRNEWAHCAFSNWDQAKFQQSFHEMQHLVRVMGLPTADEGKLLGELKDWETKGTHLCMNSPVDPALLQLIQHELKSLQDSVKNMSVEFEEEKRKVQHELQNFATTLQEMEQRVQRVEICQQSLEHRTGIIEGRIDDFEGNVNLRMEGFESSQQSTEDTVHLLQGDVQQRMEKLESSQQSTESRTMLVEDKVHHLQEQVKDLTSSKESNVSMCQDNSMPAECNS